MGRDGVGEEGVEEEEGVEDGEGWTLVWKA